MKIIRSNIPLEWGDLSLPMWGLAHDIFDQALEFRLLFSLAFDEQRLWFVAAGSQPACSHPQSRHGKFMRGLWQFDCAELFIADPRSGRYLEFNLAANGAWWSAEFVAPRQRADERDLAFPEVATFADLSPDGGWLSAMSVPLDLLTARIDWSAYSRVNVTFITRSPAQQFVSASPLPGATPNFHQPKHFSPVEWIDDATIEP